MIISTISSKGQVTIPKKIREFLQLGTYDKIVFIPMEKGKVLITSKQNPAKVLFRRLKKPVSIEEMKNSIRKRRTQRGAN